MAEENQNNQNPSRHGVSSCCMLDTVLCTPRSVSYSHFYLQKVTPILTLPPSPVPEPLTWSPGGTLVPPVMDSPPSSQHERPKQTAGHATQSPPVAPVTQSPYCRLQGPTWHQGSPSCLLPWLQCSGLCPSNSPAVALPGGVCICCSLRLAHSDGPG